MSSFSSIQSSRTSAGQLLIDWFIMQPLDLKTELFQKQHRSIYSYPNIGRCGLSLNKQKTVEPECYFQIVSSTPWGVSAPTFRQSCWCSFLTHKNVPKTAKIQRGKTALRAGSVQSQAPQSDYWEGLVLLQACTVFSKEILKCACKIVNRELFATAKPIILEYKYP